MATLTLTVPDAQIDRIVTAYGWGVGPVAANLPGETKPQFVKRMIAEQLKRRVNDYEGGKLREVIVVPVLDVT